jgi:hypothetical protein
MLRQPRDPVVRAYRSYMRNSIDAYVHTAGTLHPTV